MQEKEELLTLHDEEQKREVNLSFKTLVMVYLAVFIALAIFLPKIYIANQIFKKHGHALKYKHEGCRNIFMICFGE